MSRTGTQVRAIGAASLLTAALVSCGGGGAGSGPTAPLPSAVLTLSASPNPVVGDLCGSHCGSLVGEREALVELTIRETAGVGANVSGGSQELRNTATGAVVAGFTLVPSDFIRDFGTTRIPAGGQLVYRAGVHYPAPHAGLALTFTFAIVARDDNGHDVSVTLAVPTTG
jgi:hypothetical protein